MDVHQQLTYKEQLNGSKAHGETGNEQKGRGKQQGRACLQIERVQRSQLPMTDPAQRRMHA